MIFNRVIDRGRRQNCIEPAFVGSGIVFGKNGFDDSFFGQNLAWVGFILTLGLVVIDMEAQYVAVFDGVGDGVGCSCC